MTEEVITNAEPNTAPVEVIADTAPIESAPAVEAAPIAEVVSAEPVVTEPVVQTQDKKESSILGEALKSKEVEKPTEIKAEEPKQTEDSQSDEPAPLPTYDAFSLPEEFTLDGERVSDINKVLGEFELTTKADHAEVQKLGQALIDRHVSEVRNTIERLNNHYMEQFEKTKTDWKNDFIADNEIGGNRQDTTISSALEFIRTHGGTPEQQAEFHQLMDQTGVGSHKAMIRILANAQRNMAEGQPLAAMKPMPEAKSKYEKFYGTKS